MSLIYGFALALPPQKSSSREENSQDGGDLQNEKSTFKPEVKDICLSKHCIAASHRIFQLMNESADPCEDFSQFSCGRFFKETIIPDDKGKMGTFTVLRDGIDQRGRILLEEPIDEKTDFEGHQKAKRFYKGELISRNFLLKITKKVSKCNVLCA